MIEKILRKIWYDRDIGLGPACLSLLLTPLSVIYGLVVTLRNGFYDLGLLKSVKLPCRVISVGNLTVGGTGKTPMVIFLATMLQAHGYKPVILSRGYGGKAKEPVCVVSDGARLLKDSEEAGDEPVMIARSLPGVPVLTGPQRVLTGRWALNHLDTDVIILDDGFQHRAIDRDVNILLLNAVDPAGNGCLLPRGPLREPMNALERADVVAATGIYEDVAVSKPLLPDHPLHSRLFRCYYKPKRLLQGSPENVFPPDAVAGKKILAFAGIGNPVNFQKSLSDLGGEIVSFMAFPDHHRYGSENIRAIEEKARQCGAEMIVTTLKDKVRLDGFQAFLDSVYALSVDMAFVTAENDFVTIILDKLKDGHGV